MLAAFQRHIHNNFPELKSQKFLLACSGGVDSMVLTALCSQLKFNFALAHCNFQLRGAESAADEKFVKDAAIKYGVKFYSTHFDTVNYVRLNRVSVQMAARELRYNWFAKLMKRHAIAILATAHHADDSLETFLINLSRGTGIEGLRGIVAKKNGLYRPLLPFSRLQIEEYAISDHIEWREDSSNTDTKYLRNKIRHEIAPLLKELHPTFLKNFYKTQTHLAETNTLLTNHIQKLKLKLFAEEEGILRVPVATLQELHPQRTILYELFKEYGFTAWEDIPKLLQATSGKEVRSKTHRLVKDREVLLLVACSPSERKIYTIDSTETSTTHPLALRFEELKAIGRHATNILYVDKETLKYPLTVRKWQKGDYFYPLGMKGKKKLSKYFKDEKLDVIAKERQWLLCSEDKVVWVIGRRPDDRFKISEKTKKIVKITLN